MNVLKNNEELVYNENAMRNNNVKSTIIDKSSRNLKEYMIDYILTWLDENKKYSLDTYKNYQSDINQIAKYFFNYDDIKYITKEDLEWMTVDRLIKFRNDMYGELDEYGERKYSNATINRRFSSLKSMLRYLNARKQLNYPLDDLKTLLKNLPNESIEIDALSMEDAKKCLEFFKSKNNAFPIYLASKFSIYTGLRSREILTLQWNQFYPNTENVVVKSKGNRKGKGNKDWEKEISHELYNDLLLLKESNNKKVFNISYSFIAKVMSEAIVELGLNIDDKNYSFHSFRKCAATNLYELTHDILTVKDFLNHSNVNTTQKYVKKTKNPLTTLYSTGDKAVPDLYKDVNKQLLVEAIEDLGKDIIHLLNIKLNEKMNKIENNDKNS